MATSSASAAARPQANNRLHATAHLRFVAREPDVSLAQPMWTIASLRLRPIAAAAIVLETFDSVAGQVHEPGRAVPIDLVSPVYPPIASRRSCRVMSPLSCGCLHVTAQSPVIQILFSYVSLRSAKCLYLWHCRSEWSGMAFYNYGIRSGRCAWLWKCGWRRRQEASGNVP
jgi:hypothetical protein